MTIGTCSICGGAVTTPDVWYGIGQPTPTCENCGAVPALPHGPVVKMQPIKRWPASTGTTDWPGIWFARQNPTNSGGKV